MRNLSKRFLATLISIMILGSCMALIASADYEVHKQNLDNPYRFSQTKNNRTYLMSYGLSNAWAYTGVQLDGGSGEAAKAYAALMERTYLFGSDGDFYQASSTTKQPNGYVEATAGATTNKANYVLHSGTSNVTYGWRFDHKYER